MRPCLIFDLFHTLVHGADGERERVVAEMATIIGVQPEDLIRAYGNTWRQRLTQWGAEQTVRILAQRLGAAPSDAEVARAAGLRREYAARTLAAAAPATLDLLGRLRDEGWRLGLISNATAETALAWPDSALAAHFEAAVFSCEIGLAKPDPGIYLAAAQRLDTAPADCVYVGDGAEGELTGAAGIGMTAIRTTEQRDSDPAWAGLSVATLADLPALLDSIGPMAR